MKKIFIISSILLGVVLFFLGIYNFAFKKDAPAASQSNLQESIVVATDAKNETVEKKTEKITLVSEKAVIGLFADKKTQEITFYDAENGSFWKIGPTRKATKAIDNKMVGLKNIASFSGNGKVLVTIEKNGQNSFYVYDNLLQKGTFLKNGLDSTSWDNSGLKIFYKYYDEKSKERTLNIANYDGSGWQKLANIESRNLTIVPIPLSANVSFWNFPNAKEESRLQTVGVSGGEVKTIFAGKFGADYLWAPNGENALISSLKDKNSNNIVLGIVTIDGQYRDLGVPTFASKCAWSSDNKTIYCALAGKIPENALMPNDYQENKFNTVDTFWKINITTGEKERIVNVEDIASLFDATNLVLSPNEKDVYFINKIDRKLYRITL